tara:strand:+ start:4 stop:825 length:822 start_codon:yes stop_codon:yes gene_type:complete
MTTKIPAELSSTPGIVDNSNATAITIDSSENVTINGDTFINRNNQTSGVIKFGGTTNGGFIDFDGGSLQLNTQRDPNTGTFVNTSKSHASIIMQGNDGDSNIRFLTTSSNNTTATERLRILKSGGITFNGDSAAANALDDYEEGTWSPNFAATGLSVTHDISNGYYTKIGNHVFFSMLIGTNAVSGTSTYHLTITGLPYAALNSAISMSSGSVGLAYKFVNNENGVKWFIAANTSEIRFYDGDSNTGAITESNHLSTATTSNRMYITGHYLTA